MFFQACFLFASSQLDEYGYQFPKPFEKNGVLFTTAAIQEMKKNGITDTFVLEMVRKNPHSELISNSNIVIMLSEHKGKKEVDGVIKYN